jgi:hypothetical protein
MLLPYHTNSQGIRLFHVHDEVCWLTPIVAFAPPALPTDNTLAVGGFKQFPGGLGYE